MPRTAPVRRLLRGVALLALVAQGCAALPPEPEWPPAAPGRITVRKGRPGAVLGAPHGSSDSHSDLIGAELARRTGFGLVLATGYARPGPEGRRFNVNRPTEGVPGGAPAEELATAEAGRVYEAYRRAVREAAQGPLHLYVEIHGNGRHESAGRIEIATVGVSRDEAWRIRTLLELIRDARLEGQADVPRLDVRVEPLDRISLTASGAKRTGILTLPRRGMHIELPRAARTLGGEAYTDVLAQFLIEIWRFFAGER